MKNLKKKRIKKGMTQQSLAELLGVTRRTIWNWENEFSNPHKFLKKKLKELLEI